jgi:type II secretory ATPase GspE/PulE/Tfp pilus assembly ATPase PilB-like protein
VGIFELLPVTEEIKQLTIKKAAASVIAQTATSQGMLTLKQDGIKKVLQGITTIEEVWRTTKE